MSLPLVEFRVVSDNYFDTANIPLLRGRLFSKAAGDDKQSVVVINEAMAKHIWPNEDPIGKRVGDGTQVTVIGVVGNVKNYGLLQPAAPEMYALYTLKTFWAEMRWNMRLMVRSTLDDSNIAAAVRREVQAVDPGQPIYAVNTMNLVIENTVKDKSVNTTLLSVFAGVSLLLAVIGVYGVMSYTVAQHTREIGIRMALGAQPRSILKLIVGRGLVLVSVGAVIGVFASFGLTRFIENMLFGVTPTDPLTFVMIVTLLGLRRVAGVLNPGGTRHARRSDRRATPPVRLLATKRHKSTKVKPFCGSDRKASYEHRLLIHYHDQRSRLNPGHPRRCRECSGAPRQRPSDAWLQGAR